MSKKSEKQIVQPDEVKKWAGDIVLAAKNTIDDVVDSIKELSDDYGKKQIEAKRAKDLAELKPFFLDMLLPSSGISSSIASAKAKLPAIIHVVEKDKKHSESEVCEHSLGHISIENGIRVLNVYPHHMKDLGVVFFPNMNGEFYYVDPCQKNLYINIQEYFRQLKIARVNELEQLAYSLGATHLEIVFKTDTVELEKAQKKAEIGAKKGKKNKLDIKAEHSENEVRKESVEVERKLDLSGHDDPQVPALIYFKDDEDIRNLISMRLDKKSYLKSKECKLKYSVSSGIKASNAVKIQGALDKMGGGSAGVSLLNETLNESCTTLIYKIEF